MEGEAGRRPLGVFKCQLCALTAPYSYVGQKPPDTHSVVLLEESYVMKDPFTPDKDRFLVLGSRCSLCSRLVCVSPECSLFYSKRFCLPCVRDNMDAFPQEIRQDLEKRKAPSKRPASQPGSRTASELELLACPSPRETQHWPWGTPPPRAPVPGGSRGPHLGSG
ncbi:cysteine-rich DPF motif domain-containing protein 1 isoform 2-T4 [Lycaon pictus]